MADADSAVNEKGKVPQKSNGGRGKRESLAIRSYNDQTKDAEKNIYQEYIDQLSPEEVKMFEDEFQTYDVDNNKYITTKELAMVLRTLGENPTEDELQKMISDIDCNNNQHIEFEEFLIMMAKKMAIIDSDDELIDAFRTFDNDDNGYITAEELKAVFNSVGGAILSEDDLDELVAKADTDGDGRLNYEEFVKVIQS